MKFCDRRAALWGVFYSTGIAALLLGAAPAAAISFVVAPIDKGTVHLEKTGGELKFRLEREGEADVIQKIVAKIVETGNPVHACKLVLQPRTGPGVGLMQVPEGPSGLTNGYIGVRDEAACSEITGAESLTIALGGELEGYQVYHTELNFWMRGAAILRIDTSFEGQTRTFILKAPGSVLPNPAPPDATIIDCVYTNGVNRACRFIAADMWSSMTVTSIVGRVAIDGAGAGLPASFFKITKFEAELDCDENKETLTATDANGATAVGTRLPNTDQGSCDPIPYSLNWDNTDPENPILVFLKDDLGQAVATTFEITWPNAPTPAPGSGSSLEAVTVSVQQFVAAEGSLPLDLCVGTPVYVMENPPDGPLVLQKLEGITAAHDMSPSLPGIQYGCVYERIITYPEEGFFGLVERIYLEGDWGAGRR